jgi:hypothetical protein
LEGVVDLDQGAGAGVADETSGTLPGVLKDAFRTFHDNARDFKPG